MMTEDEVKGHLTRAVAARRRHPDADFIAHAPADVEALANDNLRLRAALTEIAKGEGAFSRDPLEHAGSCIESMKATAWKALGRDAGHVPE